MSKFSRMNSREQFEDNLLHRSIPGESLTVSQGRYPYERPAQFNDPQEAFDMIVDKVLEPKTFNATAAVLDAGYPMDSFVNAFIRLMYTEGIIDPRLIPILTVPMSVMFVRMCEALKIEFTLSTDKNTNMSDASEAEIMARFMKEQQKVANNSAKAARGIKDVKRMITKPGLMSRPEAFV